MFHRSKLWVAVATLTLLSGCSGCNKKDERASRRNEETRERPADVPRPQPSPAPAPAAPAPGHAARPATAVGEAPAPPLDALRTATVVKSCYLDLVNDHAPDGRPIARAETARFQGWAIDLVGATNPPTVMLLFESADGVYSVVGARGVKRPDVAEVFKNPVFVDAGFLANVSFADIAPGAYTVKLFQVLPQGGATVCDTGKVITVS